MTQQWETPNYAELPDGFTTTEPQPQAGAARLAVLGDPIEHSKSPQLQLAAYRALGLDWEYYRWQVPAAGLSERLNGRAQGWRGFSVTAPLKAEAFEIATDTDEFAKQTGAVNTLVCAGLDADAGMIGYNTDVYGIREALSQAGRAQCTQVHIIGAGDTAATAAVAAASMGAERIQIAARRPNAAAELAERLQAVLAPEVAIESVPLLEWRPSSEADVIVDTVPGGFSPQSEPTDSLANTTVLSAAYDPWPTKFATIAEAAGAQVVSGIELLLHQAVYQVRLFSGRDIDQALPNEQLIVDKMRAALDAK